MIISKWISIFNPVFRIPHFLFFLTLRQMVAFSKYIFHTILAISSTQIILFYQCRYLCISTFNRTRFLNYNEVFVCLVNNEWLFIFHTATSHEWIFIFAQWAENLCFTSLTQHWYHCISEAVGMDVLRNCLCIKFKLAVIIIQKIMRLRANHAISKGFCITIIFSTLFTAKSTVYLKED